MSDGFNEIAQQDFSAGMVRSVAPHLIPDNGFYDGVNLLLNLDGSPYKRGGTTYESNASLAAGLRFLWDGFLAGGQRTVFASAARLSTLAVDGATPVDVGVSGFSSPVKPAVLFGLMYLPGGRVYGGSRRSSSYSTGTVATTNLSKVVTGSGTSWLANLDAGMMIRIGGAGPLYGIASVDSDTQLTLAMEYEGATASGTAYTASPNAANPGRTASIYAAAANRLVTGEGSRIYFSAAGDPSSFDPTDFHELPGGVNVIALEGLRNNLLVFTTRGLWVVGNLAYDLTDAFGNVQQTLQKVSDDLTCWGAAGVVGYRDALIVPAVDGVWLTDAGSAPVPIATSIGTLIQAYAKAGYRPGVAAVHNNHYFLPIVDSGNVPVDLLVCRLDRPVSSRLGVIYPWTRWAGAGAAVSAIANRVTGGTLSPVLLGAEAGSSARVLRYQELAPDTVATTDADGSAPSWKLVTRDFAVDGGLRKALARRTRVRYEMLAESGVATTIELAAGTDARPASNAWGSFLWGTGLWTNSDDNGLSVMGGSAPADSGATPFVWPLNLRARYVRLRLSGATASTRMILRTIELFIRPSGRQ